MSTLNINGHNIKLELPPVVFQPNTTTRLLAKHMPNVQGKTVLDLGCGAGPIAVYAALSGAKKVYAVDIMTEACDAAVTNAELNGVDDRMEVRHSDLFGALEGLTFDIIIDDVSGMAEKVSRISPWYPDEIPTGGPDGTSPTLRMLTDSPAYLNPSGYLILPVLSLARSEKIVAAARDVYPDRLHHLESRSVPFCPELEDNLDKMYELRDEGIISFTKKRSRHIWQLDIYRATK